MPSLDSRRQQAIREFVRRLCTDIGPESDIDILVVMRAQDSERARLQREIVEIAFDVNLGHDVYISPRVVTEALLADPVWGRTPFLESEGMCSTVMSAREEIARIRMQRLSKRQMFAAPGGGARSTGSPRVRVPADQTQIARLPRLYVEV